MKGDIIIRIIKESEYFVAWLLLWLGGTIGGFILGAVAGGIVGAIPGAAGVDLSLIKLICGGIGFILGTILSYILFRWIVASMIVKKVEARVGNQMQESPNKKGLT